MTDLAAIVARTTESGRVEPGVLSWHRLLTAEQDRFDLLTLLEETRDALGRYHNGRDRDCAACEAYSRLAALDTEVPA